MFKTNLGAELESQLYGIKNHVARSWYFYNLAVIETKKIANACNAGDSSSLGGAINQTEFYMDTSFLELDEGMKESFNLIAAEEKLLSEQKIDLIKEEALYDSLIELRQIVSELNGGPTNSGSYVSFYSTKATAFANSAASKGFPELVEKRPFWLEAFGYFGGTILTQMGAGKESAFPFIWPIFNNAVSEVENVFYTKQGLSALGRFPINEFMKLYSDLGGNNASALKRFAELENKMSINQKSVNTKQKTLWDSIKGEQAKIEQKLFALNNNSKFDALAKELLKTNIGGSLDLEEKYFEGSKTLLILRERKAKNELPLGEEIAKIKTILLEFEEVSKYLGYGEEDYLQKLGGACDSITREFKEDSFSTENADFVALLNEAKYYAAKTIAGSGESKLEYCIKFWESKKRIDLVKNDFAVLESEKKDSAKDCLAYLDKVFQYAELYKLKENYLELKKTEVTKENLNNFSKACEEIKSQVENELLDQESTQTALKNYNALQNTLQELKLLNLSTPNEEFDTETNLLLKRIEQYSKYFDAQGNIYFNEFLLVQNEVISSMEKTLSDSEKLLTKGSIELVKKNAQIIYLSSAGVRIGTDTNISAKLILNNRWSELNEMFFIDVNLSNVIISKTASECLGQVFEIEKVKTRFLFNCLPKGLTEIEFWAIEHILTAEKDEFIFVSNKESTLRRNIIVSNSGELPRALIETKTPQGAYKAAALVAGNEAQVLNFGNGLSTIAAEPLPKNAKLEVYFYIYGVISVELISEDTDISIEESRLRYSIKAINNYDTELNASLFIDLPVNAFTKDLHIFDDAGKSFTPEIYSGKIILKNQTFTPKQERNYLLEITLNNTLEYYLEELQKQRNEFSLFGVQNKAIEIDEVLSIGQENNPVALKKLFESNALALSLLKKQDEEKKSAEAMRLKLLSKIDEAKESVKQLEMVGLVTDAQKLNAIITKALEENNLDTFLGVSKAYKEIISVSFSASEAVNDEAKKLFNDAKKLYSIRPSELGQLFEQFSSFNNSFELNKNTNPLESQKNFVLMKDIYSKMSAQNEDLDKNAFVNAKQLKNEIEKLGLEVNSLVDFLESELFSPAKNISDIKFVAPITESRLKTLRLNISEILNSDKSDAEKRDRLAKIKNELTNASEYLRREAVRNFNNAIDLGTSKSILSSAKQAIDENRFVSALFLLSNNSGKAIFGFDYLGFIPIGIIIAVAIILRQRFSKKGKTEEEARKLILQEWKD